MKTRKICREWRELLGAHALGHLRGAERAGLEAHLEGCPECRAEMAALKPVVGMLPHADPARFGPAPQPPADLGRRIEATIGEERGRAQRQRRRTIRGFALGGAAATIAAVVLAVFVFQGDGEGPTTQVKFAALPAGISIYATLEPHAYGTEIHMYVKGVPSGTLCRVSLRGPGGAAHSAGTFRYRWGDDSDAVLSSALDLSRTRAVVVRAGNRTFVGRVESPTTAIEIRSEEEST